jgi:hypothetical protein
MSAGFGCCSARFGPCNLRRFLRAVVARERYIASPPIWSVYFQQHTEPHDPRTGVGLGFPLVVRGFRPNATYSRSLLNFDLFFRLLNRLGIFASSFSSLCPSAAPASVMAHSHSSSRRHLHATNICLRAASFLFTVRHGPTSSSIFFLSSSSSVILSPHLARHFYTAGCPHPSIDLFQPDLIIERYMLESSAQSVFVGSRIKETWFP